MRHDVVARPAAPPALHLRPSNGSVLTLRELEILELVSRGFESPDIARGLHVSPETVRAHVAHVLGKLGARTRAEAVAVAVRNGLIA
jgi:DNA-binding CsgD family transcriptional regulator